MDGLRRLRALDGRYAVERGLGQGGMAMVYLARDLKHERRVAIKVLRPEISAVIGEERFAREILIAAQLQHPHIPGLYESGTAADLLYYVMPYVEATLRASSSLARSARFAQDDRRACRAAARNCFMSAPIAA
jgi:serine/threonine-protein kinase